MSKLSQLIDEGVEQLHQKEFPLANQDLTPVIPIELGGRVRNMRFDLNAMCTFEEITGESMFEFVSQKLSTVKLRAIIYSCLKWEDETLTLEEVGKSINLPALPFLSDQLRKGMLLALPQAKVGDAPLEVVPSRKKKSPVKRMVSTG